MSTSFLQILRLVLTSLGLVSAFPVGHVGVHPPSRLCLAQQNTELEDYLSANYPIFVQTLLKKNDKVWKAIRAEGSTCTIFAPTDQVFVDLGDKRRLQFADDRNGETVAKIASFHVLGEPVTPDELFASGGVITMGGDIPVERSTTGGIFGFGGEEDGGVTVNGAKVTESVNIGDCHIHTVDKLVSPNILWRYMDQLRIPGTS